MPVTYGLGTRPQTVAITEGLLKIMAENPLTTIRVSSTPPWQPQGLNGLKPALIDMFLAKGHTVIIDPIHLYPPNLTTAADAKAHRSDIIKCFVTTLAKYHGNPLVKFEIINEYQNPSDYYSFVQGIVTTLRGAGIKNVFVVNKPPNEAPPWKVIKDPILTEQGFHPYLNYWNPASVTLEIDRGLKILPSLVLTEIGASTKEGLAFTDALVTEVNQVFELNKDKPVEFCIWLNKGWEPNWPEYQAHGIIFPAPTPPPKTYIATIQNDGTGDLLVNSFTLHPKEIIGVDVETVDAIIEKRLLDV